MKRIAIVGAGISGLAAATILERARQSGAEIEFAIFERGSRLGGVMITDHVDGCLIEAGPDSFLTEKSWGLDFCRSLGLGDQLIGSNDSERKTYILVNGRLVTIPDGLMFMVPTKLLPTITTPLFSLSTKIRMGLEYFHAPKAAANGRDESVAELVERHYGAEMVERLADPLLAGVYGGDAASLSAAAVLPRFVDMERQYGSLSRGMLASRKKMAAMMREKHGENHRPQPRPLFSSLKNGMQQLVDAVADFIPRESVNLNRDVTAILRDDEKWRLVSAAGVESFDALVLAAPAQLAGRLISGAAPTLANELLEISYSSSVTVTGNLRPRGSAQCAARVRIPCSQDRRQAHAGLHFCAQQVPTSRTGRSRHYSYISWRSARRERAEPKRHGDPGDRAARIERDRRTGS